MINKKNRIFVTVHKGLVGSAVVRRLSYFGSKNIITVDKKNLDTLVGTNTLETNYLAVAFECLCHICRYLNENTNTYLYDYLLLLFVILQNKQDKANGLYKFSDGSARLDITSHIINGILHFTH
jgi:hypothetical protein